MIKEPTPDVKAANKFIPHVLGVMSKEERARLPSDNGGYIDGVVGKALERIDADERTPLRSHLGTLITDLYNNPGYSSGLVRDPNTGGTLMLGGDGEIVSLQGVTSERIRPGLSGEGRAYVASYSHAVPLTGPHKGERLPPEVYPIPEPRIDRPVA